MEYIIKDNYIDKNGREYLGIREVNFPSKNIMNKHLGKYICQTEREDNLFLISSESLYEGVYIYQSTYDNNKALKIFKDWASYYPLVARQYNNHKDYELIYNLKRKEKTIKLTKFPTGVVTLENYIIGQEIPFYNNSKTLFEISKEKKLNEILTYYLKIINILDELEKNDIIYTDCHAKNFVIDCITNSVNLIDFESNQIYFNKEKFAYKEMLYKIKQTINIINKKNNIDFKVEKEETLGELQKTILIKKYKNE